MLNISVGGSTKNTESFLNKLLKNDLYRSLEKYGREGAAALARATPKESGIAANSWGYEVSVTGRSASIVWTNNDIESGFPVAIMLQYGYSTGTGGYVSGRDYINPVMKPVFDKIADEVWKEVTRG